MGAFCMLHFSSVLEDPFHGKESQKEHGVLFCNLKATELKIATKKISQCKVQ